MSTIRAATLSNAAGTGPAALTGQWAAKAFCVYNQTTPAIRSSENVTSATDNSAGDFTINLTNNMANTDYAFTSGGMDTDATSSWNSGIGLESTGRAAGSYTAQSGAAASNADQPGGSTLLTGDLA